MKTYVFDEPPKKLIKISDEISALLCQKDINVGESQWILRNVEDRLIEVVVGSYKPLIRE